MTLDEAIRHCDEVVSTCQNYDCITDHYQLRNWLVELRKLRDE